MPFGAGEPRSRVRFPTQSPLPCPNLGIACTETIATHPTQYNFYFFNQEASFIKKLQNAYLTRAFSLKFY